MAQEAPHQGEGHFTHLQRCLSLAQRAPALPTNFRVGAMLVHAPTNTILSEGYTHELSGNTHAEQVCLIKIADPDSYGSTGDGKRFMKEGGVVLYTTVEPCIKRLSGEKPCVDRVLETRRHGNGIETVYVGVTEPETFVKKNEGRAKLEAEGINVVHVPGMEEEILEVATAGHKKSRVSER